jgi:clan AA aspartic protease (TIGR02281 family)
VIGANQMAEIGFERGAAGEKFTIGGVGDRKDIKGWKQTVQLALGPARYRDFSIDIQDNLEGEPLLGQDFLRNFDTDINPASGQVTFRKKGTGRPDIATRGMIDIPFEDQGTHMVVTAKVNGKPYKFYFDTGADGVAFSMKDLKALGLEIPGDAQESYTTGVGGKTRTWFFPVNSISLGNIRKEGIQVGVVESATMDHPLLGQSFFGDYRYKVDVPKHVIHFSPVD